MHVILNMNAHKQSFSIFEEAREVESILEQIIQQNIRSLSERKEREVSARET